MSDVQPESGNIEAALARLGRQPDAEIDLAESALLLAALDRPDAALTPYREALDALAGDTRTAFTGADTLSARIDALNAAMFGGHRYSGDRFTYDDLRNTNLIDVIDRKRGLPIVLSILYIHAARAQGWAAAGVSFPGHFLVRLEKASERAMLDPFNDGARLEAGDLRRLLKGVIGDEAELRPDYYAPSSDRDVLVRLQTNIKFRRLQAEDKIGAAAIVERVLLIDPENAPAWRERGLFEADAGNLRAAIEAFERFLPLASSATDRHEASALIRQLKARLN